MLARLLDAGLAQPPRLRAVLLGGAAAPTRRCSRAPATPAGPVAPTYGLTQACSQVTVGELGDARDGRPRRSPGSRVTLAPDGEILVEGPTVAGGGTLPPATSAASTTAGA